MITYKIYTGILLLLILSGCMSFEKNLKSTKATLPPQYHSDYSGDSTANAAMVRWESWFQDDTLKSLIQMALLHNQDHLKTLEQIRIAKASYRVARFGLFPELQVMAGAERIKIGEYTMDGVGNFDSNLSSTVPEDKRIPDPYRDFYLGAMLGWEIDFWGKLRNQKKAAAHRILSSQEMANHVKTWLISEVAMTYYTLMGIDAEIKILEKNIELQELAYELSIDLKGSGKENQLAIDQFEALMLNTKALLTEKRRQLRSTELYMSQILGTYELYPARTVLDSDKPVPEILSIGLPAQLLRYRPDIRMSEQELMATRFDVSVARAALFPNLQLSAMLGLNAFESSKLFLHPASAVHSIGGVLLAPVFNRQQLKMGVKKSEAIHSIAYLDYEQKVLQAYVEVLDLLNQFHTLGDQIDEKSREVNVQKRSVENSNVMFTVGYANYLEVLNAQSRALEAEIELTELMVKQLKAEVLMYRALGGGWQ
ncbi:MAG: efflux transporter outer membrane subunit [Cyclobacteriaceae bacterium]|nr:efflux transporter outer membrane subunit [Cyclobacteriaceae bacterium]